MAKYTVKGTDILHNKKIYAEGSVIELLKEDFERLSDYLEAIPESKANSSKKQDDGKQVKSSKDIENVAKDSNNTKITDNINSKDNGGAQ